VAITATAADADTAPSMVCDLIIAGPLLTVGAV
jgi:hypothetical protein